MLIRLALSLFVIGSVYTASANTDVVIKDMQELCYRLQANDQVRELHKNFMCRGSYTYWVPSSEDMQLSCTTHTHGLTKYSKSGLVQTQGFDRVERLSDGYAQCKLYTQYEVRVNDIFVHVNTCDELSVENINRLCAEEVKRAYASSPIPDCHPRSGALDESSSTSLSDPTSTSHERPVESLCRERLATVNSCDNYRR